MNEENGESLIVTDDLLVRYLLDDLQEPDRIRIQERSFIDDDLFDRLLEAENDLIDRYARGELAAPERKLFEKAVLPRESTRQKLNFADALGAATARSETASAVRVSQVTTEPHFVRHGKTAWYRLAAAAALLVMVGVVFWLVLRSPQAPPEHTAQSRRSAEQQMPTAVPPIDPSADLNNNAARPPTTVPPSTHGGDSSEQESRSGRPLHKAIATFLLAPGSTRSSEQNQLLTVKSETHDVALRLQLDEGDEHPSYGAVLRTARGKEILRKSGLAAGRFAFGKAVTVQVTARNLPPGQYEIELTGRQGAAPDTLVNYYYFTVTNGF